MKQSLKLKNYIKHRLGNFIILFLLMFKSILFKKFIFIYIKQCLKIFLHKRKENYTLKYIKLFGTDFLILKILINI